MTTVLNVCTIYDGWLKLLMVRLRAESGDEFERHVVEIGRAAAVLPYDPVRRTALVVSMPRAAVALCGEPDMLEAIAGALEGNDAATCARKEASEEGGVALKELEAVGRFWSVPSALVEEIDYYLASYGVNDRISSGGGLREEMENISVHELGLIALWSAYEAGEIKDGKLAHLLMSLRIRHPYLFQSLSNT